MKNITTSLMVLLSSMLLIIIWFVIFSIGLPFTDIENYSDQHWYKFAFNGLLFSGIANFIFGIVFLAIFAYMLLKKRIVSNKTELFYVRSLVLSTIIGFFGFYVIYDFLFVVNH